MTMALVRFLVVSMIHSSEAAESLLEFEVRLSQQ